MSNIENITCVVWFDDDENMVNQYNRLNNGLTECYEYSYRNAVEDRGNYKHCLLSEFFNNIIIYTKNKKASGQKILFSNDKKEELDGDGAIIGEDVRKTAKDYLSSLEAP